jgi:uncharacterized protein YbbC (DUF1343 family)
MVTGLALCICAAVWAGDVRFGIDELERQDFAPLAGKRVGIVANPASADAKLINTADVLKHCGKIKLGALFGPEHGIYGAAYAGKAVEDINDPETGVPMYSLFGKTRRPTTQMIKGLDALVLDLQDIGSRSYTYISTMRVCMESCAEHDVELIILDRPNPLGGMRIEGPGLRKKFESFVGMIGVPYVHGMTMGELAQLVREEYCPKFQKLCIIKMSGWKREMIWQDTGRAWIATSPHIPRAESCAFYAATGIIGELGVLNIGVGYTLPFEMVGAPWINGDALACAMNGQHMSGVAFRPVHYKPFYATFLTVPCQGVQVHLDGHAAENLVEINFRMLEALGAKQMLDAAPKRMAMFDKVCGSDEARKALSEGRDLGKLFAKWRRECDEFRKTREKYLLYQ